MAKFLLIGSHGTLGSEFKNLISGNDLILGNRPDLDITNFEQCKEFISEHSPKFVINCAAYTNVDGAESDYNSAELINSLAVKNLAEACESINATLVHFSTGMVFPGTSEQGYSEDSEVNPVNKYGESKLQGENNIKDHCSSYYIIRTEWLYGKPQTENAKKSFVELMITLGKSGKVKGVVDEIGKPTWAKDLAEAVLELISSEEHDTGIYHLANEGQASRLDWAKEIYRLKNMEVETEEVSGSDFTRAAKRPEFEIINNTKLPIMRAWQDALKEYLKP
jgi:dTDP-4-dehydrorhamnose reductase